MTAAELKTIRDTITDLWDVRDPDIAEGRDDLSRLVGYSVSLLNSEIIEADKAEKEMNQ